MARAGEGRQAQRGVDLDGPLAIPRPAPFDWPPGRPPEPDPAPPPDSPPAPPLETPLEQVMRIWLGPTVAPWPRRAQLAGWAPDPPTAYCPRCGASAGPYEADDGGCRECRPRRLPWRRAVRLGEYDGPLRRGIHELKFERSRATGARLGRLLGEATRQEMLRRRIDPARAIVVPVPASFRRRTLRGIDHTLVLSREVRRALGGRLVRALRRKHRPEQWAVAPSQRAQNVAGVFSARRRLPPGVPIVLVDDIRTTGATLRAAARALQTARDGSAGGRAAPASGRPPELWVATLAVAPAPGRRSPQRPGGGAR